MSENNTKRPKPIIFGCSGTRLSSEERTIFKNADPFGFILFKRNCETPDQVTYLILELKQAVGRDTVVVSIDQEGGRVARLQPPHWPKSPPARSFGRMYERDPEWGIEAIKLYSRIVAYELIKLGIRINFAPVVDLYNPEGSPAIGDRAFSSYPGVVAALARAQAETFMANGVIPTIKHMPGHGKLKADPHHVLPYIDTSRAELEGQDFVPFELLKDIPLAMNSHAVFSALDPGVPASLSLVITEQIIRGQIGFDGLLLSDDLTMKALSGKPGALARQALEAGNDILLHCNANASEMQAMAAEMPLMSDVSWARWTHAQAMVAPLNPAYNPKEDISRLDVLLGGLEFESIVKEYV